MLAGTCWGRIKVVLITQGALSEKIRRAALSFKAGWIWKFQEGPLCFANESLLSHSLINK